MPKILYFVSEDWNVCSHFLPMLRTARDMGLEVVVATRVREHRAALENDGYRVVALESERRSVSPMELTRNVMQMARIVRDEKPDLVHCIGLRMLVLGRLAARATGARSFVLAPIGLGHLWIENGIVERLSRPAVRFFVSKVCRGPETLFVFENPEDPRELGLAPDAPDVVLIGGAGIDPTLFEPAPEPPAPPLKLAVVARMTIPKGINDSVAAVLMARAAGVDVELHLFGSPDPSNRRSLTQGALEALATEPGVCWHGPTRDVAAVWREHHVSMLLSHREGLPRVLVEASACGRPSIATDVTGCRTIIRHEREGLLVPRGDIEATAKAIGRLATDPDLRRRLGRGARQRFLDKFTETAVSEAISDAYARLLGPTAKHA